MTPRILVSIGGGNGASYLAALQAQGVRAREVLRLDW